MCVHASCLGRIHIFYHRYDQAKAEIDRAIAINPNDAKALAGRGNILMWSGQTDAAIEALEAAQRIDPELNAVDRFALSLAYYLKGHYDAAIEQAELNLRETAGANFSRIVLAAAYAQDDRIEDAAACRDDDPPPRPDLRSAGIRHQISKSGRSRAFARRIAQGRPLRRQRPAPRR